MGLQSLEITPHKQFTVEEGDEREWATLEGAAVGSWSTSYCVFNMAPIQVLYLLDDLLLAADDDLIFLNLLKLCTKMYTRV